MRKGGGLLLRRRRCRRLGGRRGGGLSGGAVSARVARGGGGGCGGGDSPRRQGPGSDGESGEGGEVGAGVAGWASRWAKRREAAPGGRVLSVTAAMAAAAGSTGLPRGGGQVSRAWPRALGTAGIGGRVLGKVCRALRLAAAGQGLRGGRTSLVLVAAVTKACRHRRHRRHVDVAAWSRPAS